MGANNTQSGMDPLAVGGIGAIGALVSIWWERNKSKQTAGEELAIKLRRRPLKKDGFDGFWTQKEWADKPAYERGDY